LEDPPAELGELAGEPEHFSPVSPPGDRAGPFDDWHCRLIGPVMQIDPINRSASI
jgi:hypothetical protein